MIEKFDYPIQNIREGQDVICIHCGLPHLAKKQLNVQKYAEAPLYLDGFHKGFETEYFKCLLDECPNCRNIAVDTRFADNIDLLTATLNGVPEKEISKTELYLLSMLKETNSLVNLKNLYWFYDFKNHKIKYQQISQEIIKYYQTTLKNDELSIDDLIFILDVARRNGFTKEQKNIENKINKFLSKMPLKYRGFYKEVLNKEKQLQKKRNWYRA